MDTLLEVVFKAIGTPLIVLVLVLALYWMTEWIKSMLTKTDSEGNKTSVIDSRFIQPICFVVGTLLASGIMILYDFRPVDLGVARVPILDYFVQGGLLAGLSGALYDKYFKKTQ
jgi:hypothetical protein